MVKMRELLNLGEQAQLGRDWRRAESAYSSALGEAQKFDSKSAQIQVQECEARLATVYVLQGKLELAEPHYLKAKDIAVSIMKSQNGDPECFVLLDDLSDAYQLQAHTKSKAFCFQHCLTLRRAISPRHKLLPQIEVLFGCELIEHGKVAEGESYVREGYARSVKLAGEKSGMTGQLCLHIANVYYNVGNYKEAEKYCRFSEEIASTGAGGGYEVVANVTRLHATILAKLNRLEEAEHEAKIAQKIHKNLNRTSSVEYAYDLATLAAIYLQQKRYSDAESHITQALNLMRSAPNAVDALKASALETAIAVARAQKRPTMVARLQAELKPLHGASR